MKRFLHGPPLLEARISDEGFILPKTTIADACGLPNRDLEPIAIMLESTRAARERLDPEITEGDRVAALRAVLHESRDHLAPDGHGQHHQLSVQRVVADATIHDTSGDGKTDVVVSTEHGEIRVRLAQ